ncbi:MAG: hypothetical protein ACMX3H_07995 [Sodalis sp. (in: enterobacteria)]|uniref:hypothetical protein n=1 Tax=Sodalis sp. (in: enterobacteria) TaxID=1898979 RepID=UPI0039E67CD1
MPEVKLHGHVASMKKIFENQLPRDVAKDTLGNDRNSINSNLIFSFSPLEKEESKRPVKQPLIEFSERRDTPSVYGKREGLEAFYDKLKVVEKN